MSSIDDNNVLAIDFGTSNSASGAIISGEPKLAMLELGKWTIPTSIFFDREERNTLYGNHANTAFLDSLSGRYMRSIKSVLGTNLMKEEFFILGKRTDFYEVISDYIRYIKKLSERYFDRNFCNVLSGKPVHFHSNSSERNIQALYDLEKCYSLAGFSTINFLSEPEAAAQTMKLKNNISGLGMIIDIGGGTSDFTIANVYSNKDAHQQIDIIQNHGIRIGGTNFDRAISLSAIMPKLGMGALIKRDFGTDLLPVPNSIFEQLSTWHKIHLAYEKRNIKDVNQFKRLSEEPEKFGFLNTVLTERLGHKLANRVEETKISLTSGSSDNKIHLLNELENFSWPEIKEEELEFILAKDMQQIIDALFELLEFTNHSANDIKWVRFVGGSSLLPSFQSNIQQIFGDIAYENNDVFTSVIQGLTLATKTTSKLIR